MWPDRREPEGAQPSVGIFQHWVYGEHQSPVRPVSIQFGGPGEDFALVGWRIGRQEFAKGLKIRVEVRRQRRA